MTHAQLFNDHPKFGELFTDPRFVALLNYMREQIDRPKVNGEHAEAFIYRGAHKEGWLDAITKIQTLGTPPPPEGGSRPTRLYSERP